MSDTDAAPRSEILIHLAHLVGASRATRCWNTTGGGLTAVLQWRCRQRDAFEREVGGEPEFRMVMQAWENGFDSEIEAHADFSERKERNHSDRAKLVDIERLPVIAPQDSEIFCDISSCIKLALSSLNNAGEVVTDKKFRSSLGDAMSILRLCIAASFQISHPSDS